MYTLKDVLTLAALEGISLGKSDRRRLEYLQQQGLIRKEVRGRGRGKGVESLFYPDTLTRLRIVAQLQNEGVPITEMRDELERRLRKEAKRESPSTKMPELIRRDWVDSVAGRMDQTHRHALAEALETASAQALRMTKPSDARVRFDAKLNKLGRLGRTLLALRQTYDGDGAEDLFRAVEEELRAAFTEVLDATIHPTPKTPTRGRSAKRGRGSRGRSEK